MPSNRSLAAAGASVAIVVIAWVSLTLIFDLIFHFHPIFLGVAAGWALRRADGFARGVATTVVTVLLAAIGAVAGTAIIGSAEGSLDPHPFTAAVASFGIAAGIYVLYRPSAERAAG